MDRDQHDPEVIAAMDHLLNSAIPKFSRYAVLRGDWLLQLTIIHEPPMITSNLHFAPPLIPLLMYRLLVEQHGTLGDETNNLTALFHRFGINMRYLGLVRRHVMGMQSEYIGDHAEDDKDEVSKASSTRCNLTRRLLSHVC